MGDPLWSPMDKVVAHGYFDRYVVKRIILVEKNDDGNTFVYPFRGYMKIIIGILINVGLSVDG